MPRQSQPAQYVFTFGADGVVTAVAEVGRNGRLDNEKIERGESYRLIDGFVVKAEVDGREQEWEVYADRDGDGRWVEQRIDADRVRFRRGDTCIELKRSQAERLDPWNQTNSPKPWVTDGAQRC